MSQASLFTEEELEAVKSSWNILTKNGIGIVGQLILHRFFNDAPEVIKLFGRIGVDGENPESLTLEALQNNTKFTTHAKRVALAMDGLLKNLDNTDVLLNESKQLGKAHANHGVEPHYFDLLGGSVLKVIKDTLYIDATHPKIKAWVKVYTAIASAAREGIIAA